MLNSSQVIEEKLNQERPVEESIFDLFKCSNTHASSTKLLNALRSAGLRRADPRLQKMLERFHYYCKKKNGNDENESTDVVELDKEEFIKCVGTTLPLITKMVRNELAIPNWNHFLPVLTQIFDDLKANTAGGVATYIPQLAKANPDSWGVAVCTIDGQQSAWGDCKAPWCLQSVCKPFVYGIALDTLGNNVVHKYVGQEPSGRLFNEICLDSNKRPHNPMINAGSIVVSALLKQGGSLADRFESIMNHLKRISGYTHVGFSNTTFLSEKETADRNFALGYYLREHKCFPPDVNLFDVLDLYFQECSIEVTCESAAIMAATLANGGICPITNERVLENRSVRDVLSLMYSCGMYDYSGQFAFKVGLPAKSGVSGGMILVIPNLMGFAFWSPRLDSMGNTVRGVHFSRTLVEHFNFHNYDSLIHGDMDKLDPRRRLTPGGSLHLENSMFAASVGNVAALRRNVLQGASMNLSDYDDRTALHVAAANGHLEIIKFLIETCRVRVEPKDRWGRTPLDDATHFGHAECVEYLEKRGKMLKNETNHVEVVSDPE